MVEKTLTEVLYVQGILLHPPEVTIETATTLGGHLGGFWTKLRSENPEVQVNHLAWYISSKGTTQDLVMIINTPIVESDGQNPYRNSVVLRNHFDDHMRFYEEGIRSRTQCVNQIESSEPKLSDYQLMEMVGLLQR